MSYKRLFFYHGLVLLSGLLVAKTLDASIGHSATQTRFAEMHAFSVFFPEGWGFFTRNPREDKFMLYQVQPDGQLTVATYKNTSAENLYGLSRRSRRRSMEFHRVLPQVPPTAWHTLPEAPAQAAAQLPGQPAAVVSAAENHLVQLPRGQYVVQRYTITPWAWAAYQERLSPTADYARLTIR